MKVDIQKYIQCCLQCQIKKLVRVKIKNPMVITFFFFFGEEEKWQNLL